MQTRWKASSQFLLQVAAFGGFGGWLRSVCVKLCVCVCVCSSVAQKVGMRYMRRIAAQPNGGRQIDGKKIYIYIARLYCISICSCRCAFLNHLHSFNVIAYLPSTRYILWGLHDYGKLLDFYQSVSTLLYQKYIVKWMFQYALQIVLNESVDFTAVSLISTLYK